MIRNFTTASDIRDDVRQALDASPEFAGDFDVDRIVREIIERVGVEGYATLPTEEFWQIVARHDELA